MEFLNAAGKIPLLTPDEEIILGRSVQIMQQLLEDKPNGPYTQKERGVLHRGRRARERMVTANMRLVVVIAKKYVRRCDHMTMEDLMQEGVFGLIRGVEKFDPERGYRFSTYAYWWIRQSINRAVTTYDRQIRVPVHVAERIAKLRAWISSRIEADGVPTLDQCAEFLECDRETARTYLQNMNNTTSLDSKVKATDAESTSIVDMIADPNSTPWELLDEADPMRIDLVRREIAKLPEREREVIQLRFFDVFFNRPPIQVAKQLGVSRQAICDRERRIMRKLRVNLTGKVA